MIPHDEITCNLTMVQYSNIQLVVFFYLLFLIVSVDVRSTGVNVCDAGMEYYIRSNVCVYVVKSKSLPWFQARSKCMDKEHGDLVGLEDRGIVEYVKTHTSLSGNEYWIGLSRDDDTDGEFKWSHGSGQFNENILPWNATSETDPDANCVYWHTEGGAEGFLVKASCDLSFNYICQIKPGDKCQVENGGCAQTCSQEHLERKCTCREGFIKALEFQCNDIDECHLDEHTCEQKCVNEIGSYHCECDEGYEMGESKNCLDIDECNTGDHDCDFKCVNIDGAYECECAVGYNLERHDCVDIDECAAFNAGCLHNCSNSPGSYQCVCPHGYEEIAGTNGQCQDVDECTQHNGFCREKCVNTEGSYTCHCSKGYKIVEDGKCEDINECADNAKQYCKDSMCHNLPGSFHCMCHDGFSKGPNGKCQDINECDKDKGLCEHTCVNTEGGYNCTCLEGFTAKETHCYKPDTGFFIYVWIIIFVGIGVGGGVIWYQTYYMSHLPSRANTSDSSNASDVKHSDGSTSAEGTNSNETIKTHKSESGSSGSEKYYDP